MKKIRHLSIILIMAFTLGLYPFSVMAASVSLSADKQFITGLNSSYEYITKESYNTHGVAAANNSYWTSIAGGSRPNGTKYSPTKLIEGHKMVVLSAWYGETVYFRTKGSAGTGTEIYIPDYSEGNEYKSAVKILNAFSTDTGGSFYAKYIENITDSNGYLDSGNGVNIEVVKTTIDTFNKVPLSYLTNAEGDYIYDLVAIGVNTNAEPDISGAAAWALKEYIGEGYGFLVGHDTMYGYGGVANENYVPDRTSTTTPYYVNNTSTNGHWNLNWLMGVNKDYTKASPFEAASLILNTGNYRDKSTLYGDYEGKSQLQIKSAHLCFRPYKQSLYPLFN